MNGRTNCKLLGISDAWNLYLEPNVPSGRCGPRPTGERAGRQGQEALEGLQAQAPQLRLALALSHQEVREVQAVHVALAQTLS